MDSAAADWPVWTEPLRIRSHDVDCTRRATCASLCRYFLEAAWNHAEALGVGFEHLAQQGKFWVLSRLRMKVHRCPVWGSATTLRTWPRTSRPLFAMRDFEMTDAAGTTIVAGSSAWLVVDAVSKRPQRLSTFLAGLEGRVLGGAALERDPEKLEDCMEWDHAFSVEVRYADLDVNHHVNSGRYIDWMLNAYPVDFHREHSLRALEINFLGELIDGDLLSVRTRQSGATVYCHSLTKSGGAEACRARLEWERTPAARSIHG